MLHPATLLNRAGCGAAALVLSMTLMPTLLLSAGTSPAEQLIAQPRPLVIAHRGYNQFAPENTLPSFKLAKAAGADLVELDYHHTKDGVPIVIHDGTLDRTTDAVEKWGGKKLPVTAWTLTELQTLDAGKWFDPAFAGTRLPSLAQAVEFIQKGGVTLIERKAGDAATCLRLLRERQWINQLVVQSFDWEYLRDFHAQEPAQVLGALGPHKSRDGRELSEAEKALDPQWIADAKRCGARLVVWNKQVDRATVEQAHREGLKVWVYTINEAPLAEELLDAGVDGIITDNTSLIWRALALRRPHGR